MAQIVVQFSLVPPWWLNPFLALVRAAITVRWYIDRSLPSQEWVDALVETCAESMQIKTEVVSRTPTGGRRDKSQAPLP